MGGDRRGSATRHIGGRFRQGFAVLTIIAAVQSAAAADIDASQILYFEPLRVAAPTVPPSQQKSSRSRELQFDAYGRRFVLSLQPNDKLSPLLQSKAGNPSLQLYRGHIDGAAQSWVRVALADGQLRGMLWDGAELYIIEPVTMLRDSLPARTSVEGDATAIFRLADVAMKPGATSCGTDTTANARTGDDAYSSLLQELKRSPVIMQAAGASRRLEISALGDGLFLNRFATEPRARAEILQRLNYVDGIFSSQLGVEIQVPSIDIDDSLPTTLSASSLLNELANLRKRSPNLYSRGLTHLFTGRDLEGATVGIAFLDELCDRQFGAGLSEASGRSLWSESLIAAHEIGHNFGAVHDGDQAEACAGTPSNQFLMAPSINGSDKFSACSLGLMQPKAAAASCITALPPADVSVAADLGFVQKPVGRAFDWNLAVTNSGGLATVNTRAEILVPPVVMIEDAYVVGGSCTSGAGLILCQLGEIAGGNSAIVHLSLRSDVAGSNSVSAAVSADNEVRTDNNRGEGTISIDPEADLAVALQAPASVAAGSALNIGFSATNLSVIEAEAVTLSIALPEGVIASSAALNGNSCAIQAGSISCSLASLAAGASVSGNASVSAPSAGTLLLRAGISGRYVDPVAGNDTAEATVSVTSTLSTTSQSGSGGGGGSAGLSLLSTLLALLSLKHLRSRARPHARADAESAGRTPLP